MELQCVNIRGKMIGTNSMYVITCSYSNFSRNFQ